MYKVILVDDEYWALKANSKIFDWQAYGFAIVGENRFRRSNRNDFKRKA